MSRALTLHRPGTPLSEFVDSFGHWRFSGASYRSRVLPRGAVTVIIDVSRRERLDCYTADGSTRLNVPPALIAGAHSESYITHLAADAMAIHFRPGGAYPFLGVPLGDLENTGVGIDDVWGRDGHQLRERLVDAPSIAARFRLLETFLLSRARFSIRRHPGVVAAMAAIEDNPSVRIADITRRAGLSTKQMIALFRAEVGLAPKAYARVRRLQAALRHLGPHATAGARIAADIGYSDQAHFVREFRAFTTMTPTQYRRQHLILPSHVPELRQKYSIPQPPAC